MSAIDLVDRLRLGEGMDPDSYELLEEAASCIEALEQELKLERSSKQALAQVGLNRIRIADEIWGRNRRVREVMLSLADLVETMAIDHGGVSKELAIVVQAARALGASDFGTGEGQ